MLTRFIPPFRSEIPPQSEKVAAQSARFPIVAKGASLRRIPIGEVSSAGVMLSRMGKQMSLVCGSDNALSSSRMRLGQARRKGCRAAPALKGNAHLQASRTSLRYSAKNPESAAAFRFTGSTRHSSEKREPPILDLGTAWLLEGDKSWFAQCLSSRIVSVAAGPTFPLLWRCRMARWRVQRV
jgi:hypothetical protein